MQEKLFDEVQLLLQEENKYEVLRRFDPKKRESLEKNVIPEVREDIREAIGNKDYEKLSYIWGKVGATVFQESVRKYIEDLLPEDYYLDTITKKLKKYKYDIDTRVLCKKSSDDFIGFIVDRQDGWYIIAEDRDVPGVFPTYARKYEIEVVL